MRRLRARGPHRLFFLLVLLPMLCVFPYIRAVNNPNELVRVFTVMSIVEEHSFRIDEQVNRYGWVNDMARVKSPEDQQFHYYMVKAPGVVYAAVPGYWLFSKVIAPILGHHYPKTQDPQESRLWWLKMSTWAMRIWTCQIPCFLFLLWFEKYLRDFSRDPMFRYSAVAAAGLGTNYLAYTHMFASHAQYAAISFLAFATIEKELRLSRGDAKKRRWSRALLAGFLTSACVTLEYHSLFLTIILSIFALFVFWRPTRLASFALGGIVNVPPVMYFHWRAYNNPFTPGHQLLETQRFAIEHKTGLWGVIWPTWEHIAALAVDPGFGFFGMSPYMWIAVIGLPIVLIAPYGPPSQRRSIRIASVVWMLCGATLFAVNAGIIEWRAGWTVGPRYLAACPGFFALGAVIALERLAGSNRPRRAVVRGIAGGLALASILGIGTVGLLYDTLPETIARPFAQFSIPLMLTGFVPHHVLEWFGIDASWPWYVACGAMLSTALVAGLWPAGDSGWPYRGRVLAFAVALGVGLVPAFSKPEDKSALMVLHPTVDLARAWEPKGRDRITKLREAAEKSQRPCAWYHIADLDRVLNEEAQAVRDENRASIPRVRCPRSYF